MAVQKEEGEKMKKLIFFLVLFVLILPSLKAQVIECDTTITVNYCWDEPYKGSDNFLTWMTRCKYDTLIRCDTTWSDYEIARLFRELSELPDSLPADILKSPKPSHWHDSIDNCK